MTAAAELAATLIRGKKLVSDAISRGYAAGWLFMMECVSISQGIQVLCSNHAIGVRIMTGSIPHFSGLCPVV